MLRLISHISRYSQFPYIFAKIRRIQCTIFEGRKCGNDPPYFRSVRKKFSHTETSVNESETKPKMMHACTETKSKCQILAGDRSVDEDNCLVKNKKRRPTCTHTNSKHNAHRTRMRRKKTIQPMELNAPNENVKMDGEKKDEPRKAMEQKRKINAGTQDTLLYAANHTNQQMCRNRRLHKNVHRAHIKSKRDSFH